MRNSDPISTHEHQREEKTPMTYDTRYTIEILQDLAELPYDSDVVDGLRRAPRALRNLLRFCYADYELALPTTPIRVQSITRRAFVENSRMERVSAEVATGDILMMESVKFERLFARGGHATLKDSRRLE